MTSKVVFLDTSIQIERLIGSRSRRHLIEMQLASHTIQPITSHYVFMEFQRSLWADYIRVYNTLLIHTSWDDMAHALRTGNHAYRPRSVSRCLQILTQTMVACRLDQAYGIDLLKIQIRRSLPRHFWHNVATVETQIACDLVQQGIMEKLDGTLSVKESCRKASAACHLPSFLTKNVERLHLILEHLQQNPKVVKKQDRLVAILTKIIASPKDALGQSTCWPLGDIIIALQIPMNASLWTIDKDFSALAKALSIPRFQL